MADVVVAQLMHGGRAINSRPLSGDRFVVLCLRSTAMAEPLSRRAANAGARKPMSPARRVSLFEREIRVRLSAPALEILFEIAETLSEGQVAGRSYFGSTS